MSYEFFRELNTFLPLLAFGWLTYRTTMSWPATWAKPDHVGHYRAILLILLGYILLTSLGAIVHESLGTQATWVSPAYSVQSWLVLLLCWRWPRPRALRSGE